MRLLLALVAVLAACATAPSLPEGGDPVPAVHYRIERLGRHVGWLRHEVVRERGGVVVERMEVETQVARDGERVVFHAVEERSYGPDGKLRAARFRRERPGFVRTGSARCDEDGCEVVTGGDGPAVTRTLPPTRETLVQALAPQLALERGTVRLHYLDLEDLREIVREAVLVREEEVPALGGKTAARVEIRTEGEDAPTVEWLAPGTGVPLAARFADGAELLAVPEGEAKAVPSPLEVSSMAVLPLPSAVDRRRPVGEVRIVFDALPEAGRLEAPHRRYEDLPDGGVRVTTVARLPSSAKLPLDTAGFERELAVSADLDHDHPAIRALVARIPLDRVENALELAAVCAGLVDRALPLRESAGVDRASQILAAGRGGPDEAATLLVALARAVGLPARVVTGYVYAEDEGQPVLVWSAWAELWVGEWIEADPFLSELPASPLHLPVGRDGVGDSGYGLLGRLGVRTFDASPRTLL